MSFPLMTAVFFAQPKLSTNARREKLSSNGNQIPYSPITDIMLIFNMLLLIILLYIGFYPLLSQWREQCKLLNIRNIYEFEELICGRRNLQKPFTETEVQNFLANFQLYLLPVGEDWLCIWHDENGKQHSLSRGDSKEDAVSRARTRIGQLGARKPKLVHELLAKNVAKSEILRQLV